MKSERSLSPIKKRPQNLIELQGKSLPIGLKGVIAYFNLALRVGELINSIPYRFEAESLDSRHEPSVWINFNKHRNDANHLVIATKSLLANSVRDVLHNFVTRKMEGQQLSSIDTIKLMKSYSFLYSVHFSMNKNIKNHHFQTDKHYTNCLGKTQQRTPKTNVPKMNYKEIPGLQDFAKWLISQDIYRKSEIIKLQYFIRKFIQNFVTQNRITKHQWTEKDICINQKAFIVLDFFVSFYQLNSVLIDNQNWFNFEQITGISKEVQFPIKMDKKILNKILQKIKKFDLEEPQSQQE